MTTYYESFLRKDIFPDKQDFVEEIMDIYDKVDKERRYIDLVINDYINGCSVITTQKRLLNNVLYPYRRQYQCMAQYLDEEYKNKMKGGE